MRSRFVALLAATLPLLSIPAASAGPNDDMTTNPYLSQSGPTTVDIGIEQRGGTASVSRAGPSGVAPCVYEVLAGEAARQELLVLFGVDVATVDPELRYVFRLCRNRQTAVELVSIYRVGEPITQVLVDALVTSAYDHLEIPVLVQQSAPRGDAAAPMVVNLATWLWVEPASWTSVSREAAVPGARVVATARPIVATWNPGTGAADLACPGGGLPYAADTSATAARGCTYTYAASSAAQPDSSYSLSLTVRWAVTWVCEPACGAGGLPDFEITSSRLVRVAEIQALNTRNG